MITAVVLDPILNRIPDNIKHIHLMGVCGTGMAALACMLKDCGYKITGSDQNIYPPMSHFLRNAGIEIMSGYSPDNLEPLPDLVIVGNVIRAINSEIKEVANRSIPYVSMPQALAHFFIKKKIPLVVTGTHGKTTTSALLATTLCKTGNMADFFIGGIVEGFGRNYNLADGVYFVVEGDEYDTAFFDKSSKFLHYLPQYAILTSIEFDHADIFKNFDSVKKTFTQFVNIIPKEGAIIACFDDPVVAEIAETGKAKVIPYGFQPGCRWQIMDFDTNGLTSSFTLVFDNEVYGTFTVPMPGRHNVLNATAVIALLDHLSINKNYIKDGLISFSGVKRRQQIRGKVNNITVIDDFAHHPTAVLETTRALRLAWPKQRLIVIFEPRTNSSRRAIFQDKYITAFQGADVVLVREHIPLENIAPSDQFSSEKLARDLVSQGQKSICFSDTENILNFLEKFARSGDVIAIYSNGGFDDIHERLIERLKTITS